jgi:signal transduction histidine kinase
MRVLRAASPALTAALWLTAGLVVVYSLGVLIPHSSQTSLIVDGLLSVGAELSAVLVVAIVVVQTRLARPEVLLVGLAIASSTFGDLVYLIAADSEGYLPSPSAADVGYLLFYPLVFAAFIVILRRHALPRRWIGWTVALDAAVATLGAGALLVVVLGPIMATITPQNVADAAVAAAYPALDLLLVAVVGAAAASPAIDLGGRSLFFVFGLLAFAAGDVLYALLGQADLYQSGNPIDAFWPIGTGLFAWWAAGQTRHSEARPRSSATAVPILTAAVLTALAVLVAASQVPIPPAAVVLAAVAVGLATVPVVLRQIDAKRLLAAQEQLVRQLEELDRAKTEMLATVNHEIRTPLTSVRGYLELVIHGEGGLIPAEAGEMLKIADHNAERLAVLVDDMLTMSRLDAGSAKPDRQPVDLRRLLYRVVASLQPFAASRKVSLDIDEDDVDVTVLGDEAQLERAFTNLTQNAVKFTPAGGSVGLEMELDSGSVVVRVIDTGMGIPEHDLPFLFGRFYRASNAQKGAVPGTGLGLSIVHSLIRANRGDVSIASTVDVGTSVRVALPVSPPADK